MQEWYNLVNIICNNIDDVYSNNLLYLTTKDTMLLKNNNFSNNILYILHSLYKNNEIDFYRIITYRDQYYSKIIHSYIGLTDINKFIIWDSFIDSKEFKNKDDFINFLLSIENDIIL
jgi:hypothetical protein